ncbi:MAG TPA: class I adenylate-forming enzyme family protein, partial [Ilumatobacteraceae bacterium]
IAMAAVLRDRFGIGPGDRVAIAAANSPEHALAMWAVLFAGATVASLNGWWTSPELAYGVGLVEPRLVLADPTRLGRLRATDLRPTVLTLELAALVALAAGVDGGDPSAFVPVDNSPDDAAAILFTSGTTGRPKAATLTHRNIVHYVWASLLMGALAGSPVVPEAGPQPATMATSPMFHLSGLMAVLLTGPVRGTRLVFAPPGRWDPTDHLRLSAEHGVTTWGGVPTQYWRLLHHPDLGRHDLSALQSVGVGGAAMAPELIRALRDRLSGVRVSGAYGMTETVGLGTRVDLDDLMVHSTAVGEPMPTVELQIRDAGGRVTGEDQIGEIYIRTGSVFAGYWNDAVATTEALGSDGWYRTGDFGRIVDGRLHVDSRVRDLIIRAGENISPIEIEHRLVEHPLIRDAAVVGIDDAELGQVVGAAIVLGDGGALTVDDVRAWVGATLAAFKVPAVVEFHTTLPVTETGKVQKHQITFTARVTP